MRLLVALFLPAPPMSAAPFKKITNLQYAKVDNHALALDLYLPATQNAPLIVWVHGGAWRAGSKDFMPLTALVESGYAVASIDYRLSTVAKFPALIHDCKGAIRWLRAHAGEYSYNADRICIAGNSAGGHLAALIGTSNGVAALEGTVSGNAEQSSDVQAIASSPAKASPATPEAPRAVAERWRPPWRRTKTPPTGSCAACTPTSCRHS